MKKHFGVVVALLSILATMSLASTVNAANWDVSVGDGYEWDVTEATEGYKNLTFYNGTYPTGNVIGVKVVTGDVIKFTIEELNTSDTSGEACRGTLEIGNATIANTDQASIAGALALGAFAFFQPGLISSIDWNTVKANADIVGWNYTESGDSITFEYESESALLNQTTSITYDMNSGLLSEGKSNVTSSFTGPTIVTSISLKLVEEEGTDWMLIGAAAAVIVIVLGVLFVLLKRR